MGDDFGRPEPKTIVLRGPVIDLPAYWSDNQIAKDIYQDFTGALQAWETSASQDDLRSTEHIKIRGNLITPASPVAPGVYEAEIQCKFQSWGMTYVPFTTRIALLRPDEKKIGWHHWPPGHSMWGQEMYEAPQIPGLIIRSINRALEMTRLPNNEIYGVRQNDT